MSTLNINTIDDLYSSRKDSKFYDLVRLDLRFFKENGLLRHALKYAQFRLNPGGTLEISSSPSTSFGFSNQRLNFWQIRNECMKSSLREMELLHLDDKQGVIRLSRRITYQQPKTISFGIVFSGELSEEALLFSSLDSISNIEELSSDQYEVIIVGSQKYDSQRLFQRYPNQNIRYEIMDDVYQYGRFLTCKKKSLIFELAKHEILAVLHTRITFPENFWTLLQQTSFDIAAPRVVFKSSSSIHPYLDYILTGSYDTARVNPRLTLTSKNFGEKYLYFLRDRVSYIDGGITLFDKRRIKVSPYNPNIAWGEAEDLEMCGRLYYEGYLIDYLYELICESKTNKLKLDSSALRHPGRILAAARTNYAYWRTVVKSAAWKWRQVPGNKS